MSLASVGQDKRILAGADTSASDLGSPALTAAKVIDVCTLFASEGDLHCRSIVMITV